MHYWKFSNLTFSSLFISKAYKRENTTPDFKDLNVAKHMSYFHNKYVVVPADNATSNIVFVCTSHYIDCLMFSLSVLFIILFGDTLTSNTSLFGHVISIDLSAMSLLNLEYTPRAVVRLVNLFNCLDMIERSKINESLPDMTSNMMLLEVSVHKRKHFFDSINYSTISVTQSNIHISFIYINPLYNNSLDIFLSTRV